MNQPLTVENIETVVYRLPLFSPLRWGKHSVLTEVKHVLVRVTLSDGSVGVAEAPPRPTIYGETAASITSIIANEVNIRVLGQAPDIALGMLYQVKNNHTALGAVDMAIHHALAQSQGKGLADYLGCTAERLRVSYILGIGPHDAVLAEAERVFNLGVRVLKVKVGRNWDEDIERIKLLRQSYGDQLDLYADANECFTADDAARKLDQLSTLGVLYCEEPLPVEQIKNRASLRRGEHLPIIGDDSTFTIRDLRRELSFDTFDILNIKTARTGYSQSRGMWQMARNGGKGVMIGSQASTLLGTARAGLFAALPDIDHPSELSFYLNVKDEIAGPKPVLQDGYLATADLDRVTIDDDLLRDAAVLA